MEYSDVLRQVMAARGIDAKTLQDSTGMSGPYINQLCAGKVKNPTFRVAAVIANACGVSLNDFARLMDVPYIDADVGNMLSMEESGLVANYRSMTPNGQKALVEISRTMLHQFPARPIGQDAASSDASAVA